ncbi:MAG: Serine/threonine-protein kinase pkn3 [Labilithrix sp.]|nr:Serine/threonine-protein kinase pkn3 [Labilithrix sp.]
MTEPELTTPALEPGAIVSDRYRVVDRIGEGGMGVVYRVEHTHMRKLFAMKVLHREMLRLPEVVSRFEREAVLAGSIAHPNVAAATDFGKLPDGSFFLVLELVTGKSLRELVDEAANGSAGLVEMHRVLAIMRGIVAGVGAAHAKGIVHRDLKPENIMLVERDGNRDFVKVLDFGIAKGESAASRPAPGAQPLTQIGAVMGTPQYMAPEQAIGAEVDQRSDLYAIGVIFHELVAGAPPFTGDALQVLRQHLTEQPTPVPPERVVGLAVDVAAIVRKLLEKEPGARYQTAAELAAALEEPATVVVVPRASSPDLAARASRPGIPVVTGPAAVLAASEPRPRRLPSRAVFALALGGLVLGLSVIAFAFTSTGGAKRTPAAAGEIGSPEAIGSASAEPPPPGSASSASPSAVADEDEAADEPASGKAGAAPAEAPSASGSRGRKGRPRGRRTGPGGIYIPPPKEWFK